MHRVLQCAIVSSSILVVLLHRPVECIALQGPAQCTVQMVLHHMSHCAVPLNALPCTVHRAGGVPCTVPLNARHCSATVQRAEGEVSRDGA